MAPELEATYDVFISHASEDKRALVEPLAHSLESFGVRVWYDDFLLTVGDSLMRKVDEGLAKSQFGIVVISPAFLQKEWPEYELRGLAAREFGGKKIVLPVWHNVTREEVLQYSPPLADKKALVAGGLSMDQITRELVKVIRPDIYQRYLRMTMLRVVQSQNTKRIPIAQLIASKPRHGSLPAHQLTRALLTFTMMKEVLPMSLAEMIYNFRCDLDFERELRIWERIAVCYQLAIKGEKFSRKQKQEIFSFYLTASLATVRQEDMAILRSFSSRKRLHLLELWEADLNRYDTIEPGQMTLT